MSGAAPAAPGGEPIVEASRLRKVFPMSAGPVVAVDDVTLSVASGDYVAITGPSGCGKSTLLHLLGCVETPSAGSLRFDGLDVASLGDGERSRIRLARIGFVFQRFFLLLSYGPAGTSYSSRNRSSSACIRRRTSRYSSSS